MQETDSGQFDMDTTMFSYFLSALGISGTLVLTAVTIVVLYRYHDTRIWSFRWYWRNWRLMQLSAIGSLFFLAMAASYSVLHNAWAWLYLIVAIKVGLWWLRCLVSRRA